MAGAEYSVRSPRSLANAAASAKAALASDARPEDAVATDEQIRADLARLLQTRLVRESGLGTWAHPFLMAICAAVAWSDGPHDLLIAWAAAVAVAPGLRGGRVILGTRPRRNNDRTIRPRRRPTGAPAAQ